MQKHTKVYTEFFNSHTGHYPCEVCGAKAVDIHHIHKRSEFGSKNKDKQDDISNLIALCRSCHEKAHANEITKEKLKEIHNRKIKWKSQENY
ncbi:HNH endonuclease signature motif containing protein [Riemerella anatipestifer]|nr:HNH endonuclease signature motif containing protein [Riemerella anatipestifer]MDY3532632.1 HNH endonuclease signature motif containing protein [Riemerella anatipestifer]MDY3534814.1 HNH endonuclease signature motif containing protein [Riemerella anatipestifer]